MSRYKTNPNRPIYQLQIMKDKTIMLSDMTFPIVLKARILPMYNSEITHLTIKLTKSDIITASMLLNRYTLIIVPIKDIAIAITFDSNNIFSLNRVFK